MYILKYQVSHLRKRCINNYKSHQLAAISKTSQQYQLSGKGGSFTTASVPHPTPGSEEICIRTKAVGLNPLDWKAVPWNNDSVVAHRFERQCCRCGRFGWRISQIFKTADEVFILCSMGNRAGVFQEIITVPPHLVAQKTTSLTFEDAALLP